MNPVILTISPSASVWGRWCRRFKNFVRNRFFFYGGPQAVLDSLVRGFKSLRIDYKLNPKEGDVSKGSVIGVLSNVEALKWAIEAKKAGKIKKIIAGPNIMVLPTDEGGIIKDAAIDAIIAPSLWVKNFWISLAPELAGKIKIWAAGVENPGERRLNLRVSDVQPPKSPNKCLIYQKNAPFSLFEEILGILKEKKIDFRIIKYGRYKHADYFQLLEESEFMIFLSKSESQGLALCEAWMRNAPTLVWSRGFMEYKNYKWYDEKISAPYLTDEVGMFFRDAADFKAKLPVFLGKMKSDGFRPREYAVENFSDEAAARNYLKIIDFYE